MRKASTVIFTLVAIYQSAGPIIFDFNETHIYNPKWPGHAKFHAAQTIGLGTALSCGLLWFTYASTQQASTPTTSSSSERHREIDNASAALRRSHANAALFLGTVYWITQLTAILFPNTTAHDYPDWDVWFPQLWPSVIAMMFPLAAWALEHAEVSRGLGDKAKR